MKFGNETKIGLATIVPVVACVVALAIFVWQVISKDGDIDGAVGTTTAIIVGFTSIAVLVVRNMRAIFAEKAEVELQKTATPVELTAGTPAPMTPTDVPLEKVQVTEGE